MSAKRKITVALGIRYMFWYLISVPVTWFAPVREDRVILASNRGEGITGNARYLFETWKKGGNFEVWAVLTKWEAYQNLSKEHDHVLFAFSWAALRVVTQARFFILTHGRLDVPFSGFKKTIIQTWHGIPFKAIGFCRNNKVSDKVRNLFYKWLDYDSIDFFLSSSPYVTKLYRSVFSQEPDKFIETGFPRNDVFYLDRNKPEFSLKEFLKEKAPAFKKLILYAPTYRPYPSRYFPFGDRDEMSGAFIELLKQTESVCLVKSHMNQQLMLDATLEGTGRVIDISNDDRLPDLQHILPQVDILITDYSSVSIDSLLLDLPCMFIDSDIEEYRHATGDFCCDYYSLAAGAHVQSMEDMIEGLNGLLSGNDGFREQRYSARELFFSEGLHPSTERLASFMKGLFQKNGP